MEALGLAPSLVPAIRGGKPYLSSRLERGMASRATKKASQEASTKAFPTRIAAGIADRLESFFGVGR